MKGIQRTGQSTRLAGYEQFLKVISQWHCLTCYGRILEDMHYYSYKTVKSCFLSFVSAALPFPWFHVAVQCALTQEKQMKHLT